MKLPSLNEVRKPSKTLAGVTPIAVMVAPKKCSHGACLYCPTLKVPQSYTPLSPPVIRAKILKYNAFEQVKSRLKAFKLMNHPTDKIELIIMGGTFMSFNKKYQGEFIKECYDALNEKKSKNLKQAKKLNETSKNRCVALCIETRPDFCSDKEIKQMLEFGCTRVELGVQAIDDKIYKLIKRGHKVRDVIDATRRLKEAGFKVGYHIMHGLPSSNPKHDLEMFKELFENENFKPDQLKIYPCQVIRGSGLEQWHKKGKYSPYSQEEIQKLLIEMLKLVPEYCRVMRIMRELPPNYLVAGTIRIDLRKDIELEIRKLGIKLNEIRFREIGFHERDSHKPINHDLKLKITKYKASNGEEYFLQIVNKDNILFGLCRLRIGEKTFIRELHVYGKTLRIGQNDKNSFQHKGLGKQLMAEAENICKKNKIKKLYVISGVGVREYYKKLGYKLEDEYMTKEI